MRPRVCWWRAAGVAQDFLPKISAIYAAKGLEMRCDAESLAVFASNKPMSAVDAENTAINSVAGVVAKWVLGEGEVRA